MNGADVVIQTAADAGIKVCFANPGTTEIPLLTALDDNSSIRSVLGLFEGVCTGAADGYGRMTGIPALTLLHLGPGFANGIANLHNARRARTPILNLVGNQASWHMVADPPLHSDIESLGRPVSDWLRSPNCVGSLASDTAKAITEARRPPGQIATLIIPNDFLLAETETLAGITEDFSFTTVPDQTIFDVAAELQAGRSTAIYLGGKALSSSGLRWASQIAGVTGCRLIGETWPTRWERGQGLPIVEPLPYFPDAALEAFKGIETVVLAGADAPVSFFGYEEYPSILIPDTCQVVSLVSPEFDAVDALSRLSDAVDGISVDPLPIRKRPVLPSGGSINPVKLGQTIAAIQPEGSVIMNEGATSGFPYIAEAASAPPHTYLTLSGGAIGQGMPCATGAAVACPDRPVINIQADGSGMYTLQSLWTQAREHLNVTTIICSNSAYRILQIEFSRSGIKEPGPKARAMMDLSDPSLNWVQLANGMGVPAVSADSVETLTVALRRALVEPGPNLIEVLL